MKIIKAVMGLNPVIDLPSKLVLKQALGVNYSGQVIAIAIVPGPDISALFLAGLVLVSSRGERR